MTASHRPARRHAEIGAFAMLAAAATALPASAQTHDRAERHTAFPPAFEAQTRAPLVDSGTSPKVSEIATGLAHPWAIAVLPGEAGYLVTERPGLLRHVTRDGSVSAPISGTPEVVNQRQGGLLDVALAPDFDDTRRLYLTYAKPVGNGNTATAAAYARLSEDRSRLTGLTDIFVQEPGVPAPMHFGSRIVFDGDGHAFVTTGEHFTMEYRDYAQDTSTTFGVVARVTLTGEVPADNPFTKDPEAVDTIWSYGHRNIQGAMMRDGTLWTIEHGPKGGDELNRPQPGKNYGWPVISYGLTYGGKPIGSGKARMEGMEQPVYFWDPVIAPSGMVTYESDRFAAWEDDVLIGSLKPGGLVRISLDEGRVTAEERLAKDLGRVRDIEVDHDGAVLAITDYAKGRLVRITPGSDGDS